MDQHEYLNEQQLERAIRNGHDLLKSQMWVSLPCKVLSYNAPEQSVSVQPLIQQKVRQYDQNGNFIWTDQDMPKFVDLPVQFPSGGGWTMTLPLKAGDEGTMEVQSRCIDNFWLQPQGMKASSSGSWPQAEMRMHDLNDCYFKPGGRSKPNWLQNVSTTSAQLRSDDGNTVIDLAGGMVTITATTVKIVGQLQVTGEITRGVGTSDSVTLGQHRHKQDPDSHSDSEQDTHAPTAGT